MRSVATVSWSDYLYWQRNDTRMLRRNRANLSGLRICFGIGPGGTAVAPEFLRFPRCTRIWYHVKSRRREMR